MSGFPFRVVAQIDLAALRANAAAIRRRLTPGTQMLAVVKADGFGHGAVPVARALETSVEHFGVGDCREALELRGAGITKPILILGAVVDAELPAAIANEVSLSVPSIARALAIDAEAARQGCRAAVHLAIDTGMHRHGAPAETAVELGREIAAQCPHLSIEGLFTHFSSADETDRAFSHRQLAKFFDVMAGLRAHGIEPPLIHAANSAALANYDAAQLTMVRPGLALYGLNPGFRTDAGIELAPVLAVKAQIVALDAVAEGEPISYTRAHYAASPTTVATLPIGYADGYRRAFSTGANGRVASVLVAGERCPIVGRITMDYTMVDVGAVAGKIAEGDVVTLIGRDDFGNEITVDELAEIAGTIPYEIICGLGRRITKLYRDDPAAAFAPLPATDAHFWPPMM